jgi:hypothetical protein
MKVQTCSVGRRLSRSQPLAVCSILLDFPNDWSVISAEQRDFLPADAYTTNGYGCLLNRFVSQ